MTNTPPPRHHRQGRHDQQAAITALRALAPLLATHPATYAQALDWEPGYSTGGDGTGRASTPDGSPAPPGTWQPRDAEQLRTDLLAITAAAERYIARRAGLDHRTTDTGRRATTADCAGCHRTVANTEHDRLRAGLCETCRKQVYRLSLEHPGLERGELLLLWRRTIAAEVTAG